MQACGRRETAHAANGCLAATASPTSPRAGCKDGGGGGLGGPAGSSGIRVHLAMTSYADRDGEGAAFTPASSCLGLGFGRYRRRGSRRATRPPPRLLMASFICRPPLLFPAPPQNAPLQTSLCNASSPQQLPSLLLSGCCQTRCTASSPPFKDSIRPGVATHQSCRNTYRPSKHILLLRSDICLQLDCHIAALHSSLAGARCDDGGIGH